jgi:arsenite methyltransferase
VKAEIASTLLEGVRKAYAAAAREPGGKHPFPVGSEFAQSLGYPEEVLLRLPAEAMAAFAGVAHVACYAPLRAGDVVLDVGCGAGLDSLVASFRTNHQANILGVDFSEDMLRRGRKASADAGAPVRFVQASAERLPLPDASVDVAMVNGIFNLNPVREALFQELARVLRPGGRLAGAELVLSEELPEEPEPSPEKWFS